MMLMVRTVEATESIEKENMVQADGAIHLLLPPLVTLTIHSVSNIPEEKRDASTPER